MTSERISRNSSVGYIYDGNFFIVQASWRDATCYLSRRTCENVLLLYGFHVNRNVSMSFMWPRKWYLLSGNVLGLKARQINRVPLQWLGACLTVMRCHGRLYSASSNCPCMWLQTRLGGAGVLDVPSIGGVIVVQARASFDCVLSNYGASENVSVRTLSENVSFVES